MKISKLEIKNFRRFEDFSIEFEDGLIVLAGANNTGKTSLVLLLNSMFNNQNTLTDLDISMEIRNKYTKELIKYLKDKDLNNSEEFAEKLLEYMKKKENNVKDELIDEGVKNFFIRLQLTVTYDKDESIGKFADYLMDLDDSKREFYFEFTLNTNPSKLRFQLHDIKDELFTLYKNCKEISEDKEDKFYKFEKELFSIINNSLEIKYYYCNDTFTVKNNIDAKNIKSLFNFKHISANRNLDDEEPKEKQITKSIIDLNNPLDDGSNWEEEFKKAYDTIKKAFKKSKIEETMQTNTEGTLKTIKDSLDDISENEIENLEAVLDLQKKNVLNLIQSDVAINYTYEMGGGKAILGEDSQGLGVSNLIYITLEIEKFLKKADKNKVNIFVIEEPENHMHVQMQKVFISYLSKIFEKKIPVQSMITTHSTEIVKESNIDYIKVIRPKSPFKNYLVNLKQFILEHEENRTFYETLFRLNFSNIIFADYAILFEGDTERMYLEHLISRDGDYSKLSRRYIAYCQVGGAYAEKYFPLIKELKVKTCVFTDIDYQKQKGGKLLENKEAALNSKSTNTTLNNLVFKSTVNEEDPAVSDILDKVNDYENVNNNDFYCIFTQNEEDGFGRTLEDTMLFRYIKENGLTASDVFTTIEKDSWINIKENSGFIFSIPRPDKASIRYIADKIEKSNFMYSVIMNDENNHCLPNYIDEGLKWLQN